MSRAWEQYVGSSVVRLANGSSRRVEGFLEGTPKHYLFKTSAEPLPPFDPALMVNFVTTFLRPQSVQPPTTTGVVGSEAGEPAPDSRSNEETSSGDEMSISDGESVDTTDDQDEVLAMVFASKQASTASTASTVPASHAHLELDPVDTLGEIAPRPSPESTTIAAPPMHLFQPLDERIFPTLDACESAIFADTEAAEARARDQRYQDSRRWAEQHFREGSVNPMIGGGDLYATFNRQNSIDCTFDGGFGGLEDDSDFEDIARRA